MGDLATDVAVLLAQSHASHLHYRSAVQTRRAEAAREALREAERTRLEAHALDPDHTSPDWAAEVGQKFVHDELVVFYRVQLSR